MSASSPGASFPAQAPIVITGANGLVGSALARFVRGAGHPARGLVRRPQSVPDESVHQYAWDPAARSLDTAALENVGAVVHLAGENIADRRWTGETKNRI